nr:MAG TPA: hypothetical protein [Caudoviricetes sp.]DAO99199.1 MAG TPA: hypothetical protein [Caudoviricetes sp.]
MIAIYNIYIPTRTIIGPSRGFMTFNHSCSIYF